jgi:hypothetical protein
MPRGRSLYGPLPAQLDDPDSFASRLARIIEVRRELGVATASQVDIPDVADPAMLVMVHRLDDGDPTIEAPIQVTVLNFSPEPVEGTVHSAHLVPLADVVSAETGATIGQVDDLLSFEVSLPPYGALFLTLEGGVSAESVR